MNIVKDVFPQSVSEKWSWKMKYCKSKSLPPAQSWAWDKAEEAYNQYIKSKT